MNLKSGELGGPHDILPWDLEQNPNGIWQNGDWIGQTAGYPLFGKDLSHMSPCQDDPAKELEPLRLKKIQEMISSAEKRS